MQGRVIEVREGGVLPPKPVVRLVGQWVGEDVER